MKFLLGLLAFLMVAVIGAGGYYIYSTTQEEGASFEMPSLPEITMPWQKEETPQPEQPKGKGTVTIGDTKKPNDSYKVLDSLALATKANRDVIAWLELPGAEINDCVLQYLDNEFYERRDERKNYNVYGCYFMDYECPMGTREVLANNTVIYGHSAPNDDPEGPRFSKLFRFTKGKFAKENPCIFLSTAEERMTWQIFAVFYTDINFDYIRVHITDEEMVELANQAKELSIYDYGIEITPEDKILTLSTCSERDGKDGTHRFVVMAKLLPEADLGPETAKIKSKK